MSGSDIIVLFQAGDVHVCEKLLKQYKGIVDVRCDISGDTPIIAAARTQQKQVIVNCDHCSPLCCIH